MKISIITPFYEGAKYMDALVDCLLSNREALAKVGHEMEAILVNDSPWKTLEAPATESQFIKVITNLENKGIHYSRVAGLAQATGDYIMFLDQDDIITCDALPKLLKTAVSSNADVVVANASLEQADGSKLLWYRNSAHKALVGDLKRIYELEFRLFLQGSALLKSLQYQNSGLRIS